MRITYDPAKRDKTLRERGLDFADAVEVFEGPALDIDDDRFDYGELRTVTFGLLDGRMVAVVWTGGSRDRRVISMRKANEREQKAYRQRLG